MKQSSHSPKSAKTPAIGSAVLLVIWLIQPSAAYSADSTLAASIKKARGLVNEHRYSQAETAFSTLIDENPQNEELALAHGELLREMGQVDQASLEFIRASELNSTDPHPLIVLSQLALKQMELELGVSYAQEALARNPNNLESRLNFVDVLLQCDQTAEAERQLRFIPAKSRNSPEVELLAYKLCLRKSDFVGAREHMQSALHESKTTNVEMRLELSELLQTLGEFTAARTELEKVLSHDPDSLTAHLKLARLLETQFHDYESALNQYKEASRIDQLSAQAIAGEERCQGKRRNLALQLKMALREFWNAFTAEAPNSAPPNSH